jgi:septation ring formation regulator EzrA
MAKKLKKAQLGKEIKTKIRDARMNLRDKGGVKGAVKIARIDNMENRLYKILDKTAAEKKSTSPNQNKINRLDNRFNRIADKQETLFTPEKSIFKKKNGGTIKKKK